MIDIAPLPAAATAVPAAADAVPAAAFDGAPPDPRPLFARAVALGGVVIAGTPADRLDGPTPCDGFTVRELTGHLVAVLRRVAAVGWGQDPFSVPPVVSGVDDDGWPAAWAEAAVEVAAVWSDDTVLNRGLVLPFATLPGFAALAVYVGEVTVHTWDLAVATGQSPAWDDTVVAAALDASHRALPDPVRSAEHPFADAVPVASDAPAIDRLVAWQGRRPGSALA